MKSTRIPQTNLTCSRFIFGTASLLNVGNRARRLDLLAAAVDHGFTHFDTAPYYGFGMAERDLRSVLKANPQVTVTTKVGIYSPGGEEQSRPVIFARKALGRVVRSISRPTTSFDLQRAKRSLEGSLRRLGRDCIDVFMLHEPEIELVDVGGWHDWLESEVKAGRISTYGLALTAERLADFLVSGQQLMPVVQVLDSLDHKEADALAHAGRPLQITYGYVSAPGASDHGRTVAQILTSALRRNRDGAVIVSTRRIERLAQYAALAESAP